MRMNTQSFLTGDPVLMDGFIPLPSRVGTTLFPFNRSGNRGLPTEQTETEIGIRTQACESEPVLLSSLQHGSFLGSHLWSAQGAGAGRGGDTQGLVC